MQQQQQQPAMTPQQAQAQVAAHAATQPTGQGVLVRGQPRLGGTAVTNSRTGDPKFEFDVKANEFIRT